MSVMPDDYSLQVLAPDQWAAYRELRLRALQDAPDAFGSTYAEAAALPLEKWRARLATAAVSGSDLPLVAIADDALVGLVWIVRDAAKPAVCNVYQMWVAPEHRGRGVAQALLTRGIEWARASGASAMELGVTVADSPAVRLYARLGFERVGDPEPLREGSALLAQRMRLGLVPRR
jgi:GNAT superfamily N-acetyltransferase